LTRTKSLDIFWARSPLPALHQFGESDVHLSSPAIIALVHNVSYLEVTLYFCSRTLFLHPFCVDFIHTRIEIFAGYGIAGPPRTRGGALRPRRGKARRPGARLTLVGMSGAECGRSAA
jgi:hypothetical protein